MTAIDEASDPKARAKEALTARREESRLEQRGLIMRFVLAVSIIVFTIAVATVMAHLVKGGVIQL